MWGRELQLLCWCNDGDETPHRCSGIWELCGRANFILQLVFTIISCIMKHSCTYIM